MSRPPRDERRSEKQALRFFYRKVVEPLGFKFTPDAELAAFLLDQEVALEARHGIPFCPCKPIRRDRGRDMQIVCPCIPFHRQHFDAMKRCWCGLFVHQDVNDPDTLPQLTARMPANRLAIDRAQASRGRFHDADAALAPAPSLPRLIRMTGSPCSSVVAVSDDTGRAELLEALSADPHDFDVVFVESIARGYARIKDLHPDIVVVFMAIDDGAACRLLSMLSVDRSVSAIPVVTCITARSSAIVEPIQAEIEPVMSGELWM